MSKHQTGATLAEIAHITDAPARTQVDRSFGLPGRLYGATVALYLAFLGVMSAAFMNAELAIPMAVFAGFVVIAFALAGTWVTMGPANPTRQMDWGRFHDFGIETATGRLTAGQASVQVLILPVLILFWGVCVALIRALI
jgi:hypothetical protein